MRTTPIVPALMLALSASIGACEPDTVTATAEDAATLAEAPVEPASSVSDRGLSGAAVASLEKEPTSEQIAEVRRRIAARLPVGDAGRVDIVDGGIDGSPWYVNVSVGGAAVHDVLDQLEKQGATPAEVFLALAPRQLAVPDHLLRDHYAKAARGEAGSDAPRRLDPKSDLGRVELDCYGRGLDPQSFASWVDEFYAWSLSYVNWATHTEDVMTDLAKAYTVEAEYSRAMSACDASYTVSPARNPIVMFSGWNATASGYEPTAIFYIADDLADFESVRFRSSRGPYDRYVMTIFQQAAPTSQRVYVAAGSCGSSCF